MPIVKGYNPEEFDRLLEINDEAYEGIEKPSPEEFGLMMKCAVFVSRAPNNFYIPRYGYGAIVGFAVVRDQPICDALPSSVYLWSLAVCKHYRGWGVGGHFLSRIAEEYKGREIELHVNPDNPAQKLYFDYGFRVEAIARNWYGKNTNGLYMRRPA